MKSHATKYMVQEEVKKSKSQMVSKFHKNKHLGAQQYTRYTTISINDESHREIICFKFP